MKKISYFTLLTLLLSAASLVWFQTMTSNKSLFSTNIDALAAEEESEAKLGSHIETCGASVIQFDRPTQCQEIRVVCDHKTDTGCKPQTCKFHG